MKLPRRLRRGNFIWINMLTTVKGLVLHHIDYGESSVIAHVYTDLYGRISVMISGIRGRRSKFSINMIQALSLVEMEIYYRQNQTIHRVKELGNYIKYHSIPYDIFKSTQAMFIAEVLHKSLREEETNKQLFDFLEHAVQVFDLQERNANNFHVMFLVQLTRYLGFYPHDNYSEGTCIFDLRNGNFTASPLSHPDYLNQSLSLSLHRLLAANLQEAENIELKYDVRVALIHALIDYFSLHIQDFGKIKSIDVLREVLG